MAGFVAYSSAFLLCQTCLAQHNQRELLSANYAYLAPKASPHSCISKPKKNTSNCVFFCISHPPTAKPPSHAKGYLTKDLDRDIFTVQDNLLNVL